MTHAVLSRRQVLQAGAAAAAVGAMTWSARPATAQELTLALDVAIPGAPTASGHVYEVSVGAYAAEPGTPTGSHGTGEPVSPWADTTVAFRVPHDGANAEIHDWVAAARHGGDDARDISVRAVSDAGPSRSLVLHGCRPVAMTVGGFEDGVGLIEVLTLSVRDVTSGGPNDA